MKHIGKASGKLILTGEHAVVYERPAVVCAIEKTSRITVTSLETKDRIEFVFHAFAKQRCYTMIELQFLYETLQNNLVRFQNNELPIEDVMSTELDLLPFSLMHFLTRFSVTLTEGIQLEIESDIPCGFGMGSSAAVIISLARAMVAFSKCSISTDQLYHYAIDCENLCHGRSSGVDPYMSLYGGVQRFQQGEAVPLNALEAPLSLVNTGQPVCSSGESAMQVDSRVKNTGIWDQFAGLVPRLTGCLWSQEKKEELIEIIRMNNHLLIQIGVVPEKVQRFIAELERQGGAGKICGAGAVRGEAAGMLWVVAPNSAMKLCHEFDYSMLTVHGVT